VIKLSLQYPRKKRKKKEFTGKKTLSPVIKLGMSHSRKKYFFSNIKYGFHFIIPRKKERKERKFVVLELNPKERKKESDSKKEKKKGSGTKKFHKNQTCLDLTFSFNSRSDSDLEIQHSERH